MKVDQKMIRVFEDLHEEAIIAIAAEKAGAPRRRAACEAALLALAIKCYEQELRRYEWEIQRAKQKQNDERLKEYKASARHRESN